MPLFITSLILLLYVGAWLLKVIIAAKSGNENAVNAGISQNTMSLFLTLAFGTMIYTASARRPLTVNLASIPHYIFFGSFSILFLVIKSYVINNIENTYYGYSYGQEQLIENYNTMFNFFAIVFFFFAITPVVLSGVTSILKRFITCNYREAIIILINIFVLYFYFYITLSISTPGAAQVGGLNIKMFFFMTLIAYACYGIYFAIDYYKNNNSVQQ